jgi:type I restriction enzyme, S subunit
MKRYKLEELCDVKSSKRIYASDYVDKGVPFFRGKEVTELSVNSKLTEELFITFERYDEIKQKYGVPVVGDILLTAVGTIGNSYMIEKEPLYFKDGNLIWFTNYRNKLILPEYLYLVINSDYFQRNLVQKGQIGSVQNALTIEKVKRIEINVPSLDIQKSAVKKIQVFNAKLKSNIKLINELEKYLQLIFYKWFVDFNFPDYNGKPYKENGGPMKESDGRIIPIEWEFDVITSLGDIVAGGTPSTDNQAYFCCYGIPWITPKDLSLTTNKYIERGVTDITLEGLNNSSAKLMPKGTVLMSSRAPIGYLAITKNEVTTNQGFKSIVPKNGVSSEFIYYTLKRAMKKIEMIASGSTFKEVSKEMLSKLIILRPDDMVLEKFQKLTSPIANRIEKLEEENKILIETRDLLNKRLIL